jgi:aryl carrier-like protein
VLSSIWAEALNLTPDFCLNSKSNFFELGGDSVTIMIVVSLCCERSMYISVPDIYKKPTLGGFVSAVEKQGTPAQTSARSKYSGKLSVPPHFSMLGAWKQYSSVFRAIQEQLQDVEIEDAYPCTDF